MATIDSNLDQELRCARSLALWFMRDDGLTERQTDYRLRQAKYVARHRRDAIIYASAQLKSVRILVSPTSTTQPSVAMGAEPGSTSLPYGLLPGRDANR